MYGRNDCIDPMPSRPLRTFQERQRLTPCYTELIHSASTRWWALLHLQERWAWLVPPVKLCYPPPPDGGPASTCKRWACLPCGFCLHRLVGLPPPAKGGLVCSRTLPPPVGGPEYTARKVGLRVYWAVKLCQSAHRMVGPPSPTKGGLACITICLHQMVGLPPLVESGIRVQK